MTSSLPYLSSALSSEPSLMYSVTSRKSASPIQELSKSLGASALTVQSSMTSDALPVVPARNPDALQGALRIGPLLHVEQCEERAPR